MHLSVVRDCAGRANIRLLILVFVVLMGIAVALVYNPPIPTRSEEKRTKGDITFIDGQGNPLSGTLSISISGKPEKPRENVNFISWANVPNAWISFDTNNFSINLRISGDSLQGKVIMEELSGNLTAPGKPIKYL